MPWRNMFLGWLVCSLFTGQHPLTADDGSLDLRWHEGAGIATIFGDFPNDWFSRSPDRKSILLVTWNRKAVTHWTRPVLKNESLAEQFKLAALYTNGVNFNSGFPPDDGQPYYLGATAKSRGESPFDDSNMLGPSVRAHKHLWRSLGWLAPDLVIVWKEGDTPKIGLPEATPEKLRTACKKSSLPFYSLEKSHLASATTVNDPPPARVGSIPAIELTCSEPELIDVLPAFLTRLQQDQLPSISSAHQELLNRRKRPPLEIAEQLDKVYGHHLDKVMYQPALSLIARLNLDDLQGGKARYEDVKKIVADYVSGNKPALDKNPNGSVTAGHLIFSELAHRVDKQKYLPLVKAAADQIFDKDGQPLPVMPAHSEMSDALFMGGPILAAAGKLTGDERYYELCLQHIRFMQKLCLREDGIYRHSPLDEAAWGRGNGFPALGLALALSEIPESHPVHQELKTELRKHLLALVKHQDPTGMWHQVIDEPGSYREMTSSCMISFAILRGLRNGWLDEHEFRPVIKRSMSAISERIAPNGELIDVCTGTGKQKDLQAYYDRTAILGKDERGGAMAFIAVTEYARYLREQQP